MIVPFGQDPMQIQIAAAASELAACNGVTRRYGITLSEPGIRALVAGRAESLQASERVEFGSGTTKELVLAFAGSPYVSQATFVDTVLALQDLFYEVKNESLEQIPDDELIAKMRSLFDDFAAGDLGYLAEALLDGLGRRVREEAGLGDDAADPHADNAVMNAYTLAAHRYDVSRWVDDTYAPAWEGSSWLDE